MAKRASFPLSGKKKVGRGGGGNLVQGTGQQKCGKETFKKKKRQGELSP